MVHLRQAGMENEGDSWTLPLPWATVRDSKSVCEGQYIMVEKEEQFVIHGVHYFVPFSYHSIEI